MNDPTLSDLPSPASKVSYPRAFEPRHSKRQGGGERHVPVRRRPDNEQALAAARGRAGVLRSNFCDRARERLDATLSCGLPTRVATLRLLATGETCGVILLSPTNDDACLQSQALSLDLDLQLACASGPLALWPLLVLQQLPHGLLIAI